MGRAHVENCLQHRSHFPIIRAAQGSPRVIYDTSYKSKCIIRQQSNTGTQCQVPLDNTYHTIRHDDGHNPRETALALCVDRCLPGVPVAPVSYEILTWYRSVCLFDPSFSLHPSIDEERPHREMICCCCRMLGLVPLSAVRPQGRTCELVHLSFGGKKRKGKKVRPRVRTALYPK